MNKKNIVLAILKEKLLAKGAVVNCDETWCRVKVAGKFGKKYIWCMVNKELRVFLGNLGNHAGKNRLRALQLCWLATNGTQEYVTDDHRY